MTYSLDELLASKKLRAQLSQRPFFLTDDSGLFSFLDFENTSLMKNHRALYDKLFSLGGDALLGALLEEGTTCLTDDPQAAKAGVRQIGGSRYLLKTNVGPSAHLASILFGIAGYARSAPDFDADGLRFSDGGAPAEDRPAEAFPGTEFDEDLTELDLSEYEDEDDIFLHYTPSRRDGRPCFYDEDRQRFATLAVNRTSPIEDPLEDLDAWFGRELTFRTLTPALDDAAAFGWLYEAEGGELTGWISPDLTEVYPPFAARINATSAIWRGDRKALLLRCGEKAAAVDADGLRPLPVKLPEARRDTFFIDTDARSYHLQRDVDRLLFFYLPDLDWPDGDSDGTEQGPVNLNLRKEAEKYAVNGWLVTGPEYVSRTDVFRADDLPGGDLLLTRLSPSGRALPRGRHLLPKEEDGAPLLDRIEDAFASREGWDALHCSLVPGWQFARRDGAWAILRAGRMETPCAFHNIILEKQARAAYVERYGRWGLYSLENSAPAAVFGRSRFLLPCEYDAIESFKGLYRAFRGQERRLIDAAGGRVELPNARNFKRLFREMGSRPIYEFSGEKRLDVELRFDDTYREDVNPEHHFSAHLSIVPQKGSEKALEGFGLTDMQAYLLTDDGVFFAKGADVRFLDSATGAVRSVGMFNDRIVALSLSGRTLTVEYAESFAKLVSNEHRDLMGYTFEGWYDVYRVNTKARAFQLGR